MVYKPMLNWREELFALKELIRIRSIILRIPIRLSVGKNVIVSLFELNILHWDHYSGSPLARRQSLSIYYIFCFI
jgi:hypothetical protein